jgi:GTP-binding protein HflX
MKEKEGFYKEGESKRSLLVSIYNTPAHREICEEHLDELEFLCQTYGLEVIQKVPCLVRKLNAATYISSGKLSEIQRIAEEVKPGLIIFDDEISPGQQRNLEKILNIPVIDRTEVILGVFAQRAHTKEAQLQVELAEAKYQSPRLKRMWTHLSRQRATTGGGAYLKGPGEKQIELDRQMLKDRINLLQKEIDEVSNHREIQRQARMRSGIPIFAIIGYTNAGKSTLLNALTDANVFVEDKLFATLDTTTRKFTLSNHQEILLIDTVGFIRKLPHLLVAAFKSTLEEALQADILIHLVDVSHPMADEQTDATFEVLKELGAESKPVITVLNKIDKCTNRSMISKMRIKYPKTVQISALNREGFDELEKMFVAEIAHMRKVVKLRIPQSDYGAVSEVIRDGRVIEKLYDENDILMHVEVPNALAIKLKKYIQKDEE